VPKAPARTFTSTATLTLERRAANPFARAVPGAKGTSMGCHTWFLGGVYFAHWLRPDVADFARVAREITDARLRAGQAVVYLSLLREDTAPFDEPSRLGLLTHVGEVLDRCTSMHFVVEGHGFRASAHRSMVAGILLAKRRGHLFVHGSVPEALTQAERHTGRSFVGLTALLVPRSATHP
jgi:hypothetical protein